MNKDRLVVVDSSPGHYGIAWWLDEEGDMGTSIGESQEWTWEEFQDEDLTLEEARIWFECERLAGEDLAAERAWKNSLGCGIEWESKARAAKVLKEAKAQAKQYLDSLGQDPTEWPQWAQTALSQGWKPPKGWKP